MLDLRKEWRLNISEELVELFSRDEYELDSIVEVIIDSNYGDIFSEVENAIKEHIKNNIVEYGAEHKKNITLNNTLIDAINKEKKNSNDTNDDLDFSLSEIYDVRDEELEELDRVLEKKKNDLNKHISINDIINENKEAIIMDIKTNEELIKYFEYVVDYVLNFDFLIKDEKKELMLLVNKDFNNNTLENEDEISFTKRYIDYLEKQNNNKNASVKKYSNEIINIILKKYIDGGYLDDDEEFQEELIGIIVRDLKNKPVNINDDDVIDYYNELFEELNKKRIYIPDDGYMTHIIKKLFDNNYKADIESMSIIPYDDFGDLDNIDDEVRDRIAFENEMFGSKHKQNIYRKI